MLNLHDRRGGEGLEGREEAIVQGNTIANAMFVVKWDTGQETAEHHPKIITHNKAGQH